MANKKSAVSARNKRSMMSNDSLSGFTIIEVVLVLAIAGLIFMMVFIALPQLQRAQRDTQRRTNLSSFQSAITQFQANNNGKLPKPSNYTGAEAIDKCSGGTNGSKDACRLVNVYLNSANAEENTFTDPDGNYYSVEISEFGNGNYDRAETEMNHTIYVVLEARCDGETVTNEGTNPRDFAVLYKLEGSGTYCSDNH